jgi:hypothetical protein
MTRSRNIKDPSKYKTVLCNTFNSTGSCPYGVKCQFAHGPYELRVRTSITHYKHTFELQPEKQQYGENVHIKLNFHDLSRCLEIVEQDTPQITCL